MNDLSSVSLHAPCAPTRKERRMGSDK